MGARVDIEDEMGNKNIAAWAATTYRSMENNSDYCKRLLTILKKLMKHHPFSQVKENNIGMSPLQYLDFQTRGILANQNFGIFKSHVEANSEDAHLATYSPREL
jgi:hypothetical protein